jgi:hypothetical protein
MSQNAHKKRHDSGPSPADPVTPQEGVALEVMIEFEKYLQKRKEIRRLSGRSRRSRLRATS